MHLDWKHKPCLAARVCSLLLAAALCLALASCGEKPAEAPPEEPEPQKRVLEAFEPEGYYLADDGSVLHIAADPEEENAFLFDLALYRLTELRGAAVYADGALVMRTAPDAEADIELELIKGEADAYELTVLESAWDLLEPETTVSFAKGAPEPDAAALQEALAACTGYAGAPGSSLHAARGGAALLSFAMSANAAYARPAALKQAAEEGFAALEEAQREELRTNLHEEIAAMIDAAFEEFDGVASVMEDAGVADQVRALAGDPAARRNWEALRDVLLAL